MKISSFSPTFNSSPESKLNSPCSIREPLSRWWEANADGFEIFTRKRSCEYWSAGLHPGMNSAAADFDTLGDLKYGMPHHPNHFRDCGAFSSYCGVSATIPTSLNSLLPYYEAPVIVIFLRIL